MSRIVFFDLAGVSVGEIHADCSRGWAIGEGGQATVNLPAPPPEWLDLGQMALIEHPRLPAWAGMVDTPWQAAPSPAITLYNAEYLLNLRSPDRPVTLGGTAAEKLTAVLEMANAVQDLRLRAGNVAEGGIVTRDEFEQRPWWEQLVKFAEERNLELTCRPERDGDNRLVVRVDMAERLGVETGKLLHDGRRANLEVTAATADGEIRNRVIGVGNGSSQASRLQTGALLNEASASRWRLRSHAVQFQDAGSITQLERLAEADLARTAAPRVVIQANVLDQDDIFAWLRPGNSYHVHAAHVWLPGGARGWRGQARITAMAYDEPGNRVAVQLEGSL